MNQLLSARRERHRRNQGQRPMGILTAMLTACVVTLIGVFSGVDPYVVLIRAVISGVLLGTLVSVGLGIIRTANIKSES